MAGMVNHARELSGKAWIDYLTLRSTSTRPRATQGARYSGETRRAGSSNPTRRGFRDVQNGRAISIRQSDSVETRPGRLQPVRAPIADLSHSWTEYFTGRADRSRWDDCRDPERAGSPDHRAASPLGNPDRLAARLEVCRPRKPGDGISARLRPGARAGALPCYPPLQTINKARRELWRFTCAYRRRSAIKKA